MSRSKAISLSSPILENRVPESYGTPTIPWDRFSRWDRDFLKLRLDFPDDQTTCMAMGMTKKNGWAKLERRFVSNPHFKTVLEEIRAGNDGPFYQQVMYWKLRDEEDKAVVLACAIRDDATATKRERLDAAVYISMVVSRRARGGGKGLDKSDDAASISFERVKRPDGLEAERTVISTP